MNASGSPIWARRKSGDKRSTTADHGGVFRFLCALPQSAWHDADAP